MEEKVEAGETYVGGQDDWFISRNEGKKKIVVLAIEKQDTGISRMYGQVIETAGRENLEGL